MVQPAQVPRVPETALAALLSDVVKLDGAWQSDFPTPSTAADALAATEQPDSFQDMPRRQRFASQRTKAPAEIATVSPSATAQALAALQRLAWDKHESPSGKSGHCQAITETSQCGAPAGVSREPANGTSHHILVGDLDCGITGLIAALLMHLSPCFPAELQPATLAVDLKVAAELAKKSMCSPAVCAWSAAAILTLPT